MFIACNRVSLRYFFDEIKEVPYGANLWNCKSFDGEEANNDQDRKSMEIIGEKAVRSQRSYVKQG